MPEEVPELYQLIAVSGDDRDEFLQGQLTQDVERLKTERALLAAWCNAKGRVFVVLRLIALPDAIGLAIPPDMSDSVLKRLAMYRLRADVQLEVTDAWAAAAVAARADATADVAVCFAGEPPLTEYFGPGGELQRLSTRLDEAAWRAGLVSAGVPLINQATSEKFTPHMLNLDKLGAISFSKGCYTGQEIVARTENLGKSRRRLMRYRSDVIDAVPGTKMSADGKEVGEIVSSAGRELLAVVPLEQHGQRLAIGDNSAEPLGLPYSLAD